MRTFVLGLAATASPTYLNFVFIDYKGGAGFETLASLPHAVGLLTNLSPELTERALTCLQAELNYRLECFRKADEPVADLHEFWRVSKQPLPRLVVVIDEFAELAGALSEGEFMDSIIRIGRIGRAVGVHLVLATQRPAGVVTKDLKANTNYSIALRVRDQSDSVDVIDVPDAASIPPKNSGGLAYLRVGGELGPPPTMFQTAFSGFPVVEASLRHVTASSFIFGPQPSLSVPEPSSGDGQMRSKTELECLVGAMELAFANTGLSVPRRPWTDPLPTSLPLDDVSGLEDQINQEIVHFALANDLVNQVHGLLDGTSTLAICFFTESWVAERRQHLPLSLSRWTGCIRADPQTCMYWTLVLENSLIFPAFVRSAESSQRGTTRGNIV